ncbi:hypothetical protein SAMN05421780_10579 [Flexibacter flexilis DSM 6793]|uniref:Uncharacterized protein n=1 Tax=Flexibacter flexilis DSM 6793 TaxID=927664 RepID=A0A1I1ISM1_9BACT|nr:hypothetical protein [Flexibacter flexilis]SFC39234.1 hypothetical protein SAMN05421780_10579 [Flexibacter flexilis DSM 6793]
MTSISEKSFGARLVNAESLSIHLKAFGNYIPPSEALSIENFDQFLNNIRNHNANVAKIRANYSMMVEKRLQLFRKNPDSLEKILSPIGSTVRAQCGKDAKVTYEVEDLITRLRGKHKVKSMLEHEDNTKQSISQSERSYGSMTQHFSDLIVMLTAMGANYAPSNEMVKLSALNTKLTAIRAANISVITAYGSLKMATDTRQSQYLDLLERTKRIKEAVKSQFGVKSNEYALVMQ